MKKRFALSANVVSDQQSGVPYVYGNQSIRKMASFVYVIVVLVNVVLLEFLNQLIKPAM